MPRSKPKPVSGVQLAANRANAAQSGRPLGHPRSPEGKARSAQTARKHGFTASTFAVVRLEDVNEIGHLSDDAVAVYRPVNSQELFAVERIALAQQSMLRAARLESGIFTTCLNETVDERDRPLVLMNEDMCAGDLEITAALPARVVEPASDIRHPFFTHRPPASVLHLPFSVAARSYTMSLLASDPLLASRATGVTRQSWRMSFALIRNSA